MTNEFVRCIEKTVDSIKRQIHTAIIAKIVSYDPETMLADIQPMIGEDGYEYPVIPNAYVSCLRAGGFIIRPPYTEGDLVVAVVVERSVDNLYETGDMSSQIGRRRHNITDAVVIGGFVTAKTPLPATDAENLLISSEDGVHKITISPTGQIDISSNVSININAPEINLN